MSGQEHQGYTPPVVIAAQAMIENARNWVSERNIGSRIAAGAVVGGLALSGCATKEAPNLPSVVAAGHAGSEAPNTTGHEVCATTWEVVEANAGDTHRFMAEGIQEIKDAKTPEEARNAINVWMDVVKADPDLLAGANKAFFEEDVNRDELVDGSGVCVTDKAQAITTALEIELAKSDVKATEAPETATNSGTDAFGSVVVAATAGIGGDRKSVLVTTAKGRNIYVLARCGNFAFDVQPPSIIPHGPTDNPPGTPNDTPPPTERVNPKYDNGDLAGDGTPASKGKGTPDKAGDGPAGKPTDTLGRTSTETAPSVPPTKKPQSPTTASTAPQTPATTGKQPTSTNAPAPPSSSVSTTAPQNKPLPDPTKI